MNEQLTITSEFGRFMVTGVNRAPQRCDTRRAGIILTYWRATGRYPSKWVVETLAAELAKNGRCSVVQGDDDSTRNVLTDTQFIPGA